MNTMANLYTRTLKWEDQFKTWAQGPAQTEAEKCDRAVTAIKKAIQADSVLSRRSVAVFAQGSYNNRTNIRRESDVDVCVCCDDVFFGDYPQGMTKETFGFISSDYTFPQFKNDVERALVAYFGRAGVTRGNKAFDTHENTYRVDADAVPTFEHRRYYLATDGKYYFHRGVQLFPDAGDKIINWPQQHYDNGVAKRSRTQLRFKKMVRILKNLRNEMQSDGIPQANNVASFLIECLVWNAADNLFGNPTLTVDVEQILRSLIGLTADDTSCGKWVELNQLKWLFHPTQPWTRQQAHNFLCAAWLYLGF